jgi:EcsC protein family
MPRKTKASSALSRLMQSATRSGFRRAYETVQVDPQKFLKQVTRTHKLPIRAWRDMFYLGEDVITPIANRIIKSATKTAALEGMGLGMGGMLTIVPDAGILSAITIRMLQKLSLIHGFEYTTDDEVGELWMAAASAAGLDLGRDFVEKQAIERLVPRIIDRIALKVGAEVAEKWSGRLIPVISAGFGGALNYYFVRSWGRRAQKHLLARHRAVRSQRLLDLPAVPSTGRPQLHPAR